jgi:UbiD family decarboxylase
MAVRLGQPSRDLRTFLAFLQQAGRLQRVSKPVDKDWEIACIARWSLESTPLEDAYAILFENVMHHTVPVAVNLYTSRAMYAAALGILPEALFEHWAKALSRPQPPVVVEKAPVQANVATGSRVNLLALPTPVWTPGRDAGPYLSAANVITKDPETGVQNLATYRIQIHDERRLGLFFGSALQHGAMHYAHYCKRREPMPVAIVVGAPPAVNFAAAAKTAYGVDELDIAGGLMGAPLDVVTGQTVDLRVPSHAECVIEGRVWPGAQEMEGPFGEALGYMNRAALAPVVEVTAICQRHAPVHHGFVQQLPPSDGHLVMEMGALGPLWYYLTRKLRLQGVRDLAIARGSAGLAILIVQLETAHAHRAATIGRMLAKFNFGQKFMYLVDEDIDIRDQETVQWALSSRVDPKRDIEVIDPIATFQYDPSILARAAAEGQDVGTPPYPSSMAIVDATVKCRVPEVSLPDQHQMQHVLANWPATGLPPIVPRQRLKRLLTTHANTALTSEPDQPAVWVKA